MAGLTGGYTDNAGVKRQMIGTVLMNGDGSFFVGGFLPAGVDRSGTVTAAGVAQTVAPANTARSALTFQNTSDTPMRVTENGAAATATTGFIVAANGGALKISTNKAISVYCATAGKTWAATEI